MWNLMDAKRKERSTMTPKNEYTIPASQSNTIKALEPPPLTGPQQFALEQMDKGIERAFYDTHEIATVWKMFRSELTRLWAMEAGR
jgi:hypothetical protein